MHEFFSEGSDTPSPLKNDCSCCHGNHSARMTLRSLLLFLLSLECVCVSGWSFSGNTEFCEFFVSVVTSLFGCASCV